MNDDVISRAAAIDDVKRLHDVAWANWKETRISANTIIDALKDLPSAQPEITDEQAIGHLQASGWMQSHDKQMYEMGLKEQLADDSDSYDALLPSSQLETNCSEIPNTSDFVSRKAVRKMVATWSYDMAELEDVELALSDVDKLPSAHPEVIHCKDCKHYRTIGAFGVPLNKEEYFCDADNYPNNDPGE